MKRFNKSSLMSALAGIVFAVSLQADPPAGEPKGPVYIIGDGVFYKVEPGELNLPFGPNDIGPSPKPRSPTPTGPGARPLIDSPSPSAALQGHADRIRADIGAAQKLADDARESANQMSMKFAEEALARQQSETASGFARIQSEMQGSRDAIGAYGLFMAGLQHSIIIGYNHRLETMRAAIQDDAKRVGDELSKAASSAQQIADEISSLENNLDAEVPQSVPPPEGEIPDALVNHEFSSEGAASFKGRHQCLLEAKANSPHSQAARRLGLAAIIAAEELAEAGDAKGAEQMSMVAEASTDIVLGFTPYVGWSKDLYELTSGRHLISGRKLDATDRTFAALGVASAGLVKALRQAPKIVHLVEAAVDARALRNATEVAVDLSQNFKVVERYGIPEPGPLHSKSLTDELRISETFHAESYQLIETTKPMVVYRALGETSKVDGPFYSLLESKGAFQAIYDLAIDPKWGNQLTHLVEVSVPAGTRLYIGKAASTTLKFEGNPIGQLPGQGLQAIFETPPSLKWFSKPVPLGGK